MRQATKLDVEHPADITKAKKKPSKHGTEGQKGGKNEPETLPRLSALRFQRDV